MPRKVVPKKELRPAGLYWVVSLGKKYTGGSRQRRYFHSRKEAKTFLLQCHDARHKLGCEAFAVPVSLRIEALACANRLKSFNCTLSQAVEFFIKHRSKSEPSRSVDALKDEFLKSRKAMNCRPRTLVQYESYLRIISEEFGNMDLAQIMRQDIEDWLEESNWSPRTKKNYIVTLTTMLNFAVGKGYCPRNPAASIDRPILDDRPIGILTIPQVRGLLRLAKEIDMAPAVSVGLFAGLRRSEFFALDWSEVDLDGRTIEVKGLKAKTRQRRLVRIEDNLFEWLAPHAKTNGLLAPERHIDLFSERLRRLAQKAGIDPWPHNAMRHSFGSYFLGKTRNENLTASEMGNSPGVVIRHYRALVREADVVEYWKLVPATI